MRRKLTEEAIIACGDDMVFILIGHFTPEKALGSPPPLSAMASRHGLKQCNAPYREINAMQCALGGAHARGMAMLM